MSRTSAPRSQKFRLGTCTLRVGNPYVMGIVNNTPDSFSGDGLGGDVAKAVERGRLMFSQGADIVDVGGESTRPGATSIPSELETARTIPVVEELSALRPGRVSIDTMKPEVAEAALFAGASVVNDVSGLRDPKMIEVVAEHEASVIIMHMRGDPRTMQVNPRYRDVVKDVKAYLGERVEAAEEAGINPSRIMVDPGIGFGKTVEHNLEIISRLEELKTLRKPIVIGVSRKAFIGRVSGTDAPADERLPGSIVAAVLAVLHGASIVRVHDVAETVQALKVSQAILNSRRSPGGPEPRR